MCVCVHIDSAHGLFYFIISFNFVTSKFMLFVRVVVYQLIGINIIHRVVIFLSLLKITRFYMFVGVLFECIIASLHMLLHHTCFDICSEEIEERYGKDTKVHQKMSGAFYQLFSRVMKVLVGKKVTIPGAFKM